MAILAKTMTMEERKQRIFQLCNNFKENYKYYKTPDFDEANTRNRFIDPFFECLGWDIRNEKGARPDRCEVIMEDRVKISNETKFPDYVFCFGGERKYFVEAKKPSVDIKKNPEPARQVRRYAYTAKLPISVLTDFEEFAIYDTRIKVGKDDDPSKARIFFCTFEDYLDRFEEIYKWLSWEAIDLGSFDTYTEEAKEKKGTTEVDQDILDLIDGWRSLLAEDIARSNDIDIYNLNSAVQKIIDRIIFLRIAEDKQIEEYGRLRAACEKKKDGTTVYKRLNQIFDDADRIYNAGLFASDNLLDNLIINDKTLSDIILHLYYPECPYAFSVLPVEILGSIYEKFLGKVIKFNRKTKNGHSIEIEEKPEVQKAGGVYYTPSYIVKYIVQNTIGNIIKHKTVEQVSELRIIDPACGSGSFLVGAYQFLLDWHLDWYFDEKNKVKAIKENLIYFDELSKRYKLSIDEKQRILLNNIYGVDIDPQAVEVTKLSLFLKLLEEEGKKLANKYGQTSLFRDSDFKILPKLNGNIKCGNSLIESDYYKNKDMSLLNIEDQRKINYFNWKEQFPQIMKETGFDCIIGNPPYIFARDDGFTADEKEYYYAKYTLAQYQLNTYIMFVEQSYNLLKSSGSLGFIIPNNWLTIDTTSNFRKFILTTCKGKIVVNSYDKVFQGANVDTSILVFSKSGDEILRAYALKNEEFQYIKEVESAHFIDQKACIINFEALAFAEFKALVAKIESNTAPLNTISLVKSGIKAYEVGKGKPVQTAKMKDERIYHSRKNEDGLYRVYLDGNDVGRYFQGWSGQYIKYGENLAAPRKKELFEGRRILVRQIPAKLPYSVLATLVTEPVINDLNSMIIIETNETYSLEYLLGIINSKLISFWFNTVYGKLQRKLFPQFKVKELGEFPIRSLDLKIKSDKNYHDDLVSKVIQIQQAYIKFNEVVTESDKNIYSQRIEILNAQIDTVIYKLYELSEEEIEIIESM